MPTSYVKSCRDARKKNPFRADSKKHYKIAHQRSAFNNNTSQPTNNNMKTKDAPNNDNEENMPNHTFQYNQHCTFQYGHPSLPSKMFEKKHNE